MALGSRPRRAKATVIGCLAECNNCDWSSQDYISGRKQAYEHHHKTGHHVVVEETKVIVYAARKEGGV